MATAISAAYMNVPLAHTMGGEVTGSIDESIRHAISKLSHLHFVATKKAQENLIRLGEDPSTVYLTGCPRIDLAKQAIQISKEELQEKASTYGIGDYIDFKKPFILVSQHPVTSEHEAASTQIQATLDSLSNIDLPKLILWPNADAGAEKITRTIRIWKEKSPSGILHFYRNLPPELYLKMMELAACQVGNSSSALREGSFLGTPSVNVGSRQNGREHVKNVIFVPNNSSEIAIAVKKQLDHGRYISSELYGDGNAGDKIAKIISTIPAIETQKALRFK
jgi:UDP-hydrolysing UDP-N-acetyl-D-glucosamine 2-epimerase